MEMFGHNNPPMTPYEACKAHLDDLYQEAKNWLDGAPIETPEQADALGRLTDDLRKGYKAADDARKAEAKPFDDGKKEVQERYKPILTAAERAIETAKNTLTKWQVKVQAEQRAKAEAARIEAEKAAQAAAEAARAAAQTDDLAEIEKAEAQIAAAKRAQAEAVKAEKARPQVQGGARAISLRTYWTAEISDYFEALQHYSANQPEAFEALLMDLARKDLASGKRQIPGFVVKSEQRAT